MNRIRDGFFYRINPLNANQIKGFSLLPEDVDAIVFWSKNPEPFIRHLDELDRMGYNYYFQFTLNDYPRLFEPHLPSFHSRLETFLKLSDKLGAERVIWRYDPIILSSITPIEFHMEKVQQIAINLKGHTQRLTISFLDFYGKVCNRLKKLENEHRVVIHDLAQETYSEQLLGLSQFIVNVGAENSLEVVSCGERVDLDKLGIKHGSCIDSRLIHDLFKVERVAPKDPNQRSECLCAESVDVGIYNTCKFECSYCYANFSKVAIHNNVKKHQQSSPLLIGNFLGEVEIVKDKRRKKSLSKQLELF